MSACLNCGGFTRSVDPDTGERGPFDHDPRFCCEDCYAEAQMFAERARREAASDWCPACGYDRHEHADDCPSQEGITSLSFGSVGPKSPRGAA